MPIVGDNNKRQNMGVSTSFHKVILSQLMTDKEYFKAVSPYLKKDYFEDRIASVLYELISEFGTEYKKPPGKEVIEIELEKFKGFSDDEYKEACSMLNEITSKSKEDLEPKWLLNETENFCREKAIYNAIMESVAIIDGSDKKRSEGIIPSLLSDALAITFDKNVGHDYFAQAEERWDYYALKETKFSTQIAMIDKVTNGGPAKKTLNLILAPSGVGKSAVKCSLAANYIAQGFNVLYITLELAEERVAERIDANLLNIPINQVRDVPKDIFCKKLIKIKEKSYGRLVIKEYPTKVASANHFRALLDELEKKQSFKPEVVFIDYLGICASSHHKAGGNSNSYTEHKSIAEELRGLAVEREICLWSSVQSNRSGYNNTDMSETSIAESMGILMTADLVLGIIRTPELDEHGHCIIKQIKSRYGDISYFNRFLVGFDRARMKLFDVEQDGVVPEASLKDDESMQALSERTKGDKPSPKVDSGDWSF